MLAHTITIELPCIDCGVDILATAIQGEDTIYRLEDDPRCDTDQEHHDQLCGDDCPVVCERCSKHHFGSCL